MFSIVGYCSNPAFKTEIAMPFIYIAFYMVPFLGSLRSHLRSMKAAGLQLNQAVKDVKEFSALFLKMN